MGSHYSRLEVLGRRLNSIVDEERADAAKGLGREDAAEVIALVRRTLETSDYLSIKRDAISAIAYTRADLALDALLELSVDPALEPELRAQATEGLGYVIQFKSRGHPRYGEIADALVDRLADPSALVRVWAIQAIGVAFVKRARSALITLALNDKSVVDDKCWGTVRDEARAALFALEHRKDLMWPLLQRGDMDAIGEIRRLVLGYLKTKAPNTLSPGRPAPDAEDEVTVDPDEQDGETQMLREALVRQDRMPIYDGKEGRFSITPDAVIYFTPKEGGTDRERRPRWLIVAIKAASSEYPELKALLPPPPEEARQCEMCKGKGKVLWPWRRVGPFCDGCWGLGWTSLPFVSKADIGQTPDEEMPTASEPEER
ncbi:MAG: HEAT repeat domain-containing protein [Myxococcota bacterium]